MNKYNILASMIEGESGCSIPLLLEDEPFLKIFKKELKSKNDIVKSKDTILDYINNNY
tara:strand:+ start:51 stop:224 length:174 start_codon:yes stop_codon:yes gene_type:complete